MLINSFPMGSKVYTEQITSINANLLMSIPGNIAVTWVKPTSKKFAGVMLRYSTTAYPTSPTDGILAYDGTASSFNITGLSKGTTYYIRAFAYAKNTSGTKTVYNLTTDGAQVTTKTYSGPITAFTATPVVNNPNTINLAWVNPTGYFSSITIIAKIGSYPTSKEDGVIVSCGMANTATITNLIPCTDYYFRAFVMNGTTYNSNVSQEAHAKTYSSPVTNFLASVVSASSIRLTWSAPIGNYSYIQIKRKLGGYPTDADGGVIYTGSDVTFLDTGLAEATSYYYRVFVFNGETWNTDGNQASANTTRHSAGQVTFTTSQTYIIPAGINVIDIFADGGGGGGGYGYDGFPGTGGGGGYTATKLAQAVTPGTQHSVIVGEGGIGKIPGSVLRSGDGGASSFGSLLSAMGGNGGTWGGYIYSSDNNGMGGSGGSMQYGYGGSDGGNGQYYGINNGYYNGYGQGTTTRAFGEAGNTLYSGGGGAGGRYEVNSQNTNLPSAGGAGGGGAGGAGGGISTIPFAGANGITNTGGGAGGGGGRYCNSEPSQHYGAKGGDGGSGIVIIRWAEQ